VYIQGWISEQFLGSQAAFGTTFRVTGGYRKAETSFLNRVPEGFLQLVCDFIEASRNIIIDLLHKKRAKNSENHQGLFKM
jgi:hypothetical protein